MKFLALFLSLFLVSKFTVARTERHLYVGLNSTEAEMEFDFKIEINSRNLPSTRTINEQIDNQLMHLFGPMGEKVVDVLAVPIGNHKVSKVSQPQLKPGTQDTYTVNYHYKGKIVVEHGPRLNYKIVLPFNPQTVYERSGRIRNANPCTDEHYNSEGDFWYFWNPKNTGCKLEKGIDYDVIETSIRRTPNTIRTYPEYSRLIRKIDGKNVIIVSILLGMDEPSKGKNPLTSRDVNAKNYVDIRNSLKRIGFTQQGDAWTKKTLDEYLGVQTSQPQFVEEFVQSTPKTEILVRLSFGPSGIDEESDGFHHLFKDALENSSVMVYDGHSGLGGHLDLNGIEAAEGFKITFSKDYQIYFFNSCSSYTYYNTQYFSRKEEVTHRSGTKDLDILTNGLATYFTVMHDTNLVLVQAISNWAKGKATTSYQSIAKDIDSKNLFGVNGDEDNPTSPR